MLPFWAQSIALSHVPNKQKWLVDGDCGTAVKYANPLGKACAGPYGELVSLTAFNRSVRNRAFQRGANVLSFRQQSIDEVVVLYSSMNIGVDCAFGCFPLWTMEETFSKRAATPAMGSCMSESILLQVSACLILK